MHQISGKKECKTRRLGWEGDPMGIVQEILVWPYQRVVYEQPRIHPGEWDAQNSPGFWDTNGWPNLDKMTTPSDSQ